jgi:hypothetical protein
MNVHDPLGIGRNTDTSTYAYLCARHIAGMEAVACVRAQTGALPIRVQGQTAIVVCSLSLFGYTCTSSPLFELSDRLADGERFVVFLLPGMTSSWAWTEWRVQLLVFMLRSGAYTRQ